MTDQPADLSTLVPFHARPADLEERISKALQVTTREQLAALLGSVSWAGRGPGYCVAVLRNLTAQAGREGQGARGSQEDHHPDGRPTVTASPALLAAGVGRFVTPHRYVPSTDTPPYCGRCGLDQRNRLHS